MAFLFFTVIIIAAFIAMASVTQLETSHYLWGGETMTAGGTFLARFGTYAILMSNMIPISLLVIGNDIPNSVPLHELKENILLSSSVLI